LRHGGDDLQVISPPLVGLILPLALDTFAVSAALGLTGPIRHSSAWVIPTTRIQDATSQSSSRAGNSLMALPGGLRRCPAISPDLDGQPAGGVAYRVAYGPNNGPIPAVLSVAVVRLGNRSVFQDRLNRPL
jgi:hypothetical protein